MKYSRAASTEAKASTGEGRDVARQKAGQSARRKFHLGGGRRGLRGDLRNQDRKVITAVHVVEARPREIEKYRRRTEGEVYTGKGPPNGTVVRREARIQAAEGELGSHPQEVHRPRGRHNVPPQRVTDVEFPYKENRAGELVIGLRPRREQRACREVGKESRKVYKVL